jgi:hypothetical protein
MKTPDIESIGRSLLQRGLLLIPLAIALAWFILSPTARAVDPPPGGGYSNQNTAEDDDALFSLTTDADNTAMGFDAPHSNTTGFDNALAFWTWRHAGSLNTARGVHTATKAFGLESHRGFGR